MVPDGTSWFCFQPLMLLTCWKKDRAGNCEGVLCLSQKAAFGSDPHRMRNSSIWDPVKLTSPASCPLDVKPGQEGPSRQGERGHVVDIRYSINLGASREAEEDPFELSKTAQV